MTPADAIPPSPAPPLAVENLAKSYRVPGGDPFPAVKGISFTIGTGECFGLLGPNGAGKSTSMNCIVGFYPPSTGQVRLLGIDVHAEPKKARAHLGVCSQDDTLDTDFSVFDQMVLYASFFRIPEAEAEGRTRHLLDQFGLAAKAKEPVESLSGGMRRRLQVARALVSEPRVLVLDEPTTGLDPEARRVVWGVIDRFRAGGGAVLLSTHYMQEAERLCDRVAIIHQGLLLDVAPPADLIARHIGQAAVREEIRPGVHWERPPNLEDVYLKLTGLSLEESGDGAGETPA
ncbi:MAG: ABC transporter ATP-binding protein [Candidatus Riflebacteria bacterium]|nr:ABC transporter ATP-binding protein [Candidatus Riflebacteria bacterium]